MEEEEQKKIERVTEWFKQGLEAGFSEPQLHFLKDYFAFWADVPKTIEDIL